MVIVRAPPERLLTALVAVFVQTEVDPVKEVTISGF
jgi:hypothetical protein